MEIGIYTLADIGPDPLTGRTISAKQRLDELVQAAKLADEAGLDVIGVGEHHRLDYAVSSPPVVLAAMSQVTKSIKLSSATTVLSTVDPVRLYEDFATLDLLSNGRAEIIAGRGAFVESFPLFGYELEQYDELFEENAKLFMQLNEEEKVTWRGQFRSALEEAEIAPRALQTQIPLWVGVGGTLESAERAGRLGAGLAMAILGGDSARFKPLVDAYHRAASQAGVSPERRKVAVTGHAYISATTEQAREEFFPYYSSYSENVNRQLGRSVRVTRADFDRMSAPDTALFVGSSEQVIEKILTQYEMFGHQRFLAQLDIGSVPFEKVAESIERLATEVAPVIRRETRKQVSI